VETLEKAGKGAEEVDKKKDKPPEGFQVPPNPDIGMGMGMGVGVDGMGYGVGYGYGAPMGTPALALMPPPGSMPGFGGAYPAADYTGGMGMGMQQQYDPSAQFGYGNF